MQFEKIGILEDTAVVYELSSLIDVIEGLVYTSFSNLFCCAAETNKTTHSTPTRFVKKPYSIAPAPTN